MLILITMFINLVFVKIDLSSWYLLSSHLCNYLNTSGALSSSYLGNNNVILNFPFINSSSNFNYYIKTKIDFISVMYNDSTTDIRMFNLLKTNNYTVQGLVSDSLNYTFISNFTNLLYNTIEVIVLSILIFLSKYRKKNEIITI